MPLTCPFPFSAGTNLGVLVTIPQKLVNGTVGQPVLLPVSYSLNDAPQFPLSVVWAFVNSSNVLISCTLLGCALGAGKVPRNCSSKCVPPGTQCKQLELFPENGSLLLRDLQLSSAGTYIVTFRPPHQAWTIDLAVHEQPPSPWHPGERLPKGAGHRHLPCCSRGRCRGVPPPLSKGGRGFPGMSCMVLSVHPSRGRQPALPRSASCVRVRGFPVPRVVSVRSALSPASARPPRMGWGGRGGLGDPGTGLGS